jgi:formate hydrogenlyase subunit 4
VELALALLFAPLLTGVVRRTKAWFAGRTGPPLAQAYYDLAKLARKGAVYSRTTTWVFRAGPLVGLACVLGALALAPLGPSGGSLAFPGDLLLLVALLALGRFATALAALDTGSAFEGMGASRELAFASLAEPALLLSFASLAHATGETSLSAIWAALDAAAWEGSAGLLLLVGAALFGVLLVENARIPFDDPTTHLELTMIHEVMVLDHGGPDLAAIEGGAMLKLWLLASLLASLALPVRSGSLWVDGALHVGGIAAVAVAVGVIESSMARLRLPRVPQILIGFALLALLSLLLVPGGGVVP